MKRASTLAFVCCLALNTLLAVGAAAATSPTAPPGRCKPSDPALLAAPYAFSYGLSSTTAL